MIPERYKFLLPIIVAVILLLGVQIGYFLKDSDNKKILHYNNGQPTSTVDEILGLIQANYTDTVSGKTLQNKAIAELLQSLDPHSTYFPPAEARDANDEIEGRFFGIGIEYTLLNDTLTVVKVIPGGPSSKADVRVGDKIVAVNGRPFTGPKINSDSITHGLRGELNTKVDIKCKRENAVISKTIIRGQIKPSSVSSAYLIRPKVGYISINEFTSGVSIDFVRALDSLKKVGMTQLVIDLRGNPGGLLDEVVKICDEFLDENKLIVYTKGRAFPKQEYKCKTQGDFEEGKLIILVDELSASASEIMAGAMQDWERATIVGRRTFGKGLVQTPFTLSNGGSLHLTVARYFTPSGRCIQRSYANGFAAYYHSITDRVIHNTLKADSTPSGADTTHYYTLINHKPVFAGGGITPDVIVNSDTNTIKKYDSYPNSELLKQAAFTFYMHNKVPSRYKDVAALMEDKTLAANLCKQLEVFMAQKHIAVMNTITDDYLRNRLLANYARFVYNDNAYRYIINSQDNVYNKALSLLNK